MATTSKIVRQHPVNHLLSDAVTAVRSVRKMLRPETVLTHRDAQKLLRLMDETVKTRDLAIYRARQVGYTVKEIAEWYGLTPARVSQICKNHPKAAVRVKAE